MANGIGLAIGIAALITTPAAPRQDVTGRPTVWAKTPQQRQALWKKDWVVYAKTPLGEAAQVLQYLSRYTHRSAIGNERIRSITPREVAFSARAKASADGPHGKQGKKRTVHLAGLEFVGRFLQHILPSGLKRIRHYGLLANPNGYKLPRAKAALGMPAPNPVAKESAQDFMARVAQIDASQCPACERGRLHVVQTCQGHKRLPDPMAARHMATGMQQQSRAPAAQGP